MVQPSNLIALLSGQPANLVSVDINQKFETANYSVPVFAAPVFSALGILNVDVALDIVASLFYSINVQAGIDTNGFYVKESTNSTDYVMAVGGSFGGTFTGTGRITILPFARLTATPGITLTGGALLDSRDQDDKLRIHELLDKKNVSLAVAADLTLDLTAKVGFLDLGITFGAAENFIVPPYRATTGLSFSMDAVFDKFEAELKEPIELAKQYLNPLGNIGAIIDGVQVLAENAVAAALELVGDALELG